MPLRSRSTFGLLLLGLALLCAAPRPAAADFAVSISDLTGIGPFGLSGTGGWEFTVNSPITVTQLGFFDSGQDGLVDAHPVGLWDLSQTLLVSGTFDSVTSVRWAKLAARDLAHATVVQILGVGHGVTAHSECAQDVVASFLAHPNAPDTSCVPSQTVPPFG